MKYFCFQGMVSHILELEGAKKRMEKELLAERYVAFKYLITP